MLVYNRVSETACDSTAIRLKTIILLRNVVLSVDRRVIASLFSESCQCRDN